MQRTRDVEHESRFTLRRSKSQRLVGPDDEVACSAAQGGTVIEMNREVAATLQIQRAVRRKLAKYQCQEATANADDECSVCMELLCEPVRWPAAGASCVHSFCKPCARRWGKQAQPRCPLCRAPASKMRLSPSRIEIDAAMATRIQQRHPQRYKDTLELHRQLSLAEAEALERVQARAHVTRDLSSMLYLDLPLCLDYPDIQQKLSRYSGHADTFQGRFRFCETAHLNALALALTRPRHLLLVLHNTSDCFGARVHLVEVASVKGRWRRTQNHIDALSALVQKRSRSPVGAVTVKLRAYHSTTPVATAGGASGTLRLECNSWADEGVNFARQGRVKRRTVPLQRQPPPSFLEELGFLEVAELFA